MVVASTESLLPEEKPKNKMVQSRTETALDLASFMTSAVPWIGGPVSNVLGGISTGRKFDRVREVLEGVAEDLQNFRSEVSEQYVKTEQFEELLEETLKRTAGERAEEKRRVYRAFLSQSIKHPGEPYDEQLGVLRTLEQLQPAHLQVLVALDSEPDEDPYAVTGRSRFAADLAAIRSRPALVRSFFRAPSVAYTWD
jgi:hypothetical protein